MADEPIVDYLPNELDEYDSSTYHFKFYAIDSVSEKKRMFLNPTKSYTIAETGVTEVSIDDVKITSIPGITQRGGTGTTTEISFTIRQPFSASLIDDIREGLQGIGRNNHLKMSYFLQLSFRGRDANYSMPTLDTNGKTWLWGVAVMSVDIHVDTSGSEYNFKCIARDNIGNMDHIGNLQQTISVTAGTVGEFLDGLTFELNKIQDEKVRQHPNTQLIKDKWDFRVFGATRAPELANVTLPNDYVRQASALLNSKIIPPAQKRSDRYAQFSPGQDPNKTQVTFDINTDMVRIIDSVLANTEYFEKKIQASANPDNYKSTDDAVYQLGNDGVFSQLYRVETGTDLIDYDYYRDDFARTYLYRIVLFDISTLILRPDDIQNASERSKNRYDTYRKKHLLNKRYDYIFTGQNTQITKFDIKFNYAWYVELPMQLGKQVTQNAAEAGANWQPVPIDNNLNKGTFAAKVSTNTQSAGETTPVNRTEYVSSDRRQVTSPGLQNVTITEQANLSSEKWAAGIENSKGSGRSFLSSLFTQLAHSKNADFITITLEIKGDPYWIAPGPVTSNTKTAFPSLDLDLAGDVIEYYNFNTLKSSAPVRFSQNYLLFTTRTPDVNVITWESGSKTNLKTSPLLSAVYTVIQVQNYFSKGKFTQELECVRDSKLDLTQIKEIK